MGEVLKQEIKEVPLQAAFQTNKQIKTLGLLCGDPIPIKL